MTDLENIKKLNSISHDTSKLVYQNYQCTYYFDWVKMALLEVADVVALRIIDTRQWMEEL